MYPRAPRPACPCAHARDPRRRTPARSSDSSPAPRARASIWRGWSRSRRSPSSHPAPAATRAARDTGPERSARSPRRRARRPRGNRGLCPGPRSGGAPRRRADCTSRCSVPSSGPSSRARAVSRRIPARPSLAAAAAGSSAAARSEPRALRGASAIRRTAAAAQCSASAPAPAASRLLAATRASGAQPAICSALNSLQPALDRVVASVGDEHRRLGRQQVACRRHLARGDRVPDRQALLLVRAVPGAREPVELTLAEWLQAPKLGAQHLGEQRVVAGTSRRFGPG